MTHWPAEHHEALKNHLAAGLSASQAAAELSSEFRTPYSKNAVIGRAARNGLALNGTKGGLKPVEKSKRRPKTPPILRPKVEIRKAANGPKLVAKPFVPRVVYVEPRHVSLLELTEDTCRWPISTVGEPDFCFCGNPPIEGLPYCGGHSRLAYRTRETRQ